MSDPLPFFIVDVFAEHRYEGNPLAVVLPPPAADPLSGEAMLAIAREMNYSETTFVEEDSGRRRFRVRIFTPEEEIPFAGHPVLGTAWVLREECLRQRVPGLRLDLAVGEILVTFEENGGRVWMEQPEPSFGEVFDPAALAGVLNLTAGEIDTRFPVQQVSTGLPFILVPLRTLEGVRRSVVDRRLLDRLLAGRKIADRKIDGILVFAPQAREPGHDLSVRVFVPFLGIPEDPATGSANGCLAAWLVRHRYFGSPDVDVRVGQGHEVHRPSLLALRAGERDGRIRVSVGGRVMAAARGELV